MVDFRTHPSHEWEKLGDKYYKNTEMYKLSWRIKDLKDYTIRVQSNGGAIAIALDPKRSSAFDGRTLIRIYSSSGILLNQLKLDFEKVIAFGWNEHEELIVVLAEGIIRIYDLLGTSFTQLSLSSNEFSSDGIMDCRFLSRGLVGLHRKKRFFYLDNYKQHTVIPFKDTVGDIPYCWSVLEADLSTDKTMKVYAAVEQGVAIFDASSKTVVEVGGPPIIFMSISSNGKFIASYNENGLLYVHSIDLSSKICEYQVKEQSTPNQVLWCGSDCVLIVWDLKILMVGPGAVNAEITLESFSFLRQELDGARVLSRRSLNFIFKVPDALEQVFKIGSTSAGAVLFDAIALHELQSPKANENIRSILPRLEEGVDACIDSSRCEFDVKLCKKLLQAASFGKSYLRNYNPEKFVYTCKVLRVLQALHFFEVGLPMTFAQFEKVGVEYIMEMLMRRNQHFLASRIAEFMQVPSEFIIVHWACAKIRNSAENEEDISRSIISKLEALKFVSFSKIAETAYSYGQSRLAIKLLEYEKDPSNQVPLLLMMSEDDLALQRSIESGDADLTIYTLMHLRRKLALSDFFRSMNVVKKAKPLFEAYAADLDSELLKKYYYHEDLRYENGSLCIMEAMKKELKERVELLKKGLAIFNEDKALAVASLVTTHQIKLISFQQKLESEHAGEAFCNGTVISTLYKLFAMGLNSKASKLKTDFSVSDKRFALTRVKVYVDFNDFEGLEQFVIGKKPACGYEAVVYECIRVGRSRDAFKYVPKCPIESHFRLYLDIGKQNQSFIRELGDRALQIKSVQLLQALLKMANNPVVREDLNLKISQLLG